MNLKYNKITIFPSNPELSDSKMVCFLQKSWWKSTHGQSQHSQHLFDMKSRQLRAICALIGSWYQRQPPRCGSTHLFNRMVSVRADCVFILKLISPKCICIFQWQDLPKKKKKWQNGVCSIVRYYCVCCCLKMQTKSEYDFRFLEMSSQIYFLSNCFMGTLGGLIKRDKEATKVPSWAMIA